MWTSVRPHPCSSARATWHRAGGKDGHIRLLTAAGIAGASPHEGGEAQIVSTPSASELFTAPAVLHSSGAASVFAADNGATTAWTLSGGQLSQAWQNGTGGTSPVVAGGLLYVYDPGGGGLRVLRRDRRARGDAHPGQALTWNSPIIADGRIALPEGNANSHATSGVLDIWRVP